MLACVACAWPWAHSVNTLALAVRDNSVAAAAMPLPCVATAVVRTPK